MSKLKKMPATTADYKAFQAKHGKNSGVGLARDHKGVYAHTHRARSDSYASAGKIPKSAVKWIESTG